MDNEKLWNTMPDAFSVGKSFDLREGYGQLILDKDKKDVLTLLSQCIKALQYFSLEDTDFKNERKH